MRTRRSGACVATFAALVAFPAAAAAVVTVRIDPPVYVPNGADQVVSFEVYAEPSDDSNERLNAFVIAIEAPSFGGPRQPRFVIPSSFQFDLPTLHPYVFGDQRGCDPVDPAGVSDQDTVLMSAVFGELSETDINDAHDGFARINVFVPADANPGFYPLTFDHQFLNLGSAGVAITVSAVDDGFFVPEPSWVGLLAPVGVLLGRVRGRSPRRS
jgi:hypothetical protein